MEDAMNRPKFALLALALGLGLLITLRSAVGASNGKALGHIVRFDLVQIVQGTVLACGTDMATDAASGDVINLTGSGEFKPGPGDAAGGGTFVQTSGTTEIAHGVWLVTGFISWQPAGGTLPPVADGIGQASEASSGIVTLAVRLFPLGGPPHDGVLTVDCHLPGATFPVEEGVTLTVGPLHFTQSGGNTLFHILG
jgi:hypothetical protein